MKATDNTNGRILIVLALLLVGLLFVTIRLFFLQVAKADDYRRMAKSQRMEKIDLPAKRGRIIDRDGEVLAESRDAETVYATPYLVKDPKKTASKLAPILSRSPSSIEKSLRTRSGFVYLARKVDPEVADALRKTIKDNELEGIGFFKDTKRCYPFDSIASQVLGFVNIDDKGIAGLELYYDSFLKGKPGKLLAELDPVGHEIPGGLAKLESPIDGFDIQVSIDKDIQYKAQQEIENAVKEFKASSGIAIVMNPKTGEIYAMAGTPSFNPNDDSIGNQELVRNRSVSDTYEPGSTMKVFTASAALEEKLFEPEDELYLPPTIQVGGRTIGEAHPREAKTFTFSEVVQESSNVGAVTIGLRLGKEKLTEYIRRFGLTEPTGIDLPGEAIGYAPLPGDWSPSTIGNIPFGQGLAVTPIGLLRGVSAVANDGVLPNPHLLLRVTDGKGRVVKEFKARADRRAILPETAGEMRGILEKVISAGTGKLAAVQGYMVAGKTGTAQKPKPEVGYASGAYVGSFVGYLPSRDPKVAILVILDEPKTEIYGGVVAAPAFSRIAEFAMRHLRIPPQ